MFEKTFVMHFIFFFFKLKKRRKRECNVLQATNAQNIYPGFFASLKQLRKYDFNFFKLKKLKKHEFNSLVSFKKLKKHA